MLVDAVEKAKAAHGAVHVMGLLSEAVYTLHEDHIVAMCELALKRGATVYLHAFLDGRDTPHVVPDHHWKTGWFICPVPKSGAYCLNDWPLFCYGPRQSLEPC